MIRGFLIPIASTLIFATGNAGLTASPGAAPPGSSSTEHLLRDNQNPLPGPGIVQVVYIVHDNREVESLRHQLDGLALRFAGVHHHVVTSVSELKEIIGGDLSIDVATPLANRANMLVFDSMGHMLAQHNLNLNAAGLLDDITQCVDATTTSDAIDQYNLPRNNHLAIKGYDPVEYIANARARRGSEQLETKFRGGRYRFVSKENQQQFASDPWRYLPAYGGWCASAMGDGGRKVDIDPTNFKVKGGRLFLFYKSLIADALKDWNRHEVEWEPAADGYWKQLTIEDPIKPAEFDRTSQQAPAESEK